MTFQVVCASPVVWIQEEDSLVTWIPETQLPNRVRVTSHLDTCYGPPRLCARHHLLGYLLRKRHVYGDTLPSCLRYRAVCLSSTSTFLTVFEEQLQADSEPEQTLMAVVDLRIKEPAGLIISV
ncbi:hypothetical protein NDU88_002826 [Pleurodeles waltl]|uniref:Uncharacterized protein n=1 Tax=Pleurodeles waltl TaxID=8319 RepID=A0AAV7RGG7_PLEWA|nr:hypothetical protein NDU88_002826 [Pleurodeles waltl]